MGQSCYVCGGYLYRGVRHRTCEPVYRRHRFNACEVCGELSRGARHRRCGTVPVGYTPCPYCGSATRGSYHNTCMPIALGRLAIFPDMPGVVQRQCSSCHEWSPFAAIDGDEAGTLDSWSPHGKSQSGRPVFAAMCRACMQDKRRKREQRGHQGERPTTKLVDTLNALRRTHSIAQTAAQSGYSKRTVVRHTRKAA